MTPEAQGYEKRASLPAGGAGGDAREAEDPSRTAARASTTRARCGAWPKSRGAARSPPSGGAGVPGADVDAINGRNAHFNKKLKAFASTR